MGWSLALRRETPAPESSNLNVHDSDVNLIWLSDDGREVPSRTIASRSELAIETTIGRRFLHHVNTRAERNAYASDQSHVPIPLSPA
jgi:hypothetical protein